MKHQEQKNTGSLSHYDRTVFQELQSSIVLSWSYPQRYHCVSTKTNWKHFFRRLWETEPVDTNLQNSKKQNRFFFFFSNLVIRLFIRSIRRWQQLVPLTVLQLETAVMSATCAAITSRTGKYSIQKWPTAAPRADFMSYTGQDIEEWAFTVAWNLT